MHRTHGSRSSKGRPRITYLRQPDDRECEGPQFSQEAFTLDIAYLHVRGEVCSCNAQLFRDVIKSVESTPSLVIDLQKCEFMDSSNFGVLLSARRRYDSPSRRLYLLVAAGNVLRSLLVTRLDRVFNLLHDRSELLTLTGVRTRVPE